MSVKFPNKIKWSWSWNSDFSNPNIIDYGYEWLKDQYKDWTGNKGLEEQNQRDYELGLKQLELLDKQNKETNAISRENIDMQKDIAMQNLGLQQSQFDYQKRLNQLTMEREDNSFQRQVEDLKAAGLSPLMAAGGASASNLSSAPAPQIDTSGISAAQGSYLSLAQQYSALKQETMSNIRSNTSKNAQAIASNKQGAAFALANLVKGAAMDLNESYWKAQNYRMQAERQDVELKRINEQIESSKQEREWMNKHGYRNRDILNVLVPILENYLSDKNANDVIDDIKDLIDNISDNGVINDTKEKINNMVQDVVDNSNQVSNNVKEAIKEGIKSLPTTKANNKIEFMKASNELAKQLPDDYKIVIKNDFNNKPYVYIKSKKNKFKSSNLYTLNALQNEINSINDSRKNIYVHNR